MAFRLPERPYGPLHCSAHPNSDSESNARRYCSFFASCNLLSYDSWSPVSLPELTNPPGVPWSVEEVNSIGYNTEVMRLFHLGKKAPRNTARAIVLHDGNVMLIERWRPGKHYFSVPGGGIEAGETPEVTVIREVMEETGCEVTVQRLLYTLSIDGKDLHSIFLCEYVSGEPHLPADSPEAMRATEGNYFKPRWLPLSELATAEFTVWKPIADQLLKDLEAGFSETPRELALKG
jgi:8-oxo-dGTP diphosphatase